jgi:hypothetical protein
LVTSETSMIVCEVVNSALQVGGHNE